MSEEIASGLIDNRSSDATKAILPRMRVQVFKRKENDIQSSAIITDVKKSKEDLAREAAIAREADSFYGLYGGSGELSIISPPGNINFKQLANMRDNSAELGPDISAMATNIEKTGWRVVPRDKITKRNEELPTNIKREIAVAENFFRNCVLDQEVGSFERFRERVRVDLELTGMFFVEVLPRRNNKQIPAGLKHIPSWTMRITSTDRDATEYDVPVPMKVNDEKWTIELARTSKKFRRYVQLDDMTRERIYFKEWGDPREISKHDGRVISEENQNTKDERAHEVIFYRHYAPTTPYGWVKYYGASFAVYGARGAEEINFVSLDNNQIPALALLATNVAVTDGSIGRLKEFFEEKIQGDRNYAQMILIEAEPVGEGMKDPTAMKLAIEKLTSEQHTDAMFKEYIEICDRRVRRSWRLPPLMVGASEEYTKATAVASQHVAEQQIYVPERNDMDMLWTSTIIARLGLAHVRFKSNSPQLTDGFELTQLLATAEGSGGLTPRTSTKIVEDVMNIELPEPDSSINPDIPFSLTKERERAKLFQAAQESSNDTRNVVKSLLPKEDVDPSPIIKAIWASDIPDDAKKDVVARVLVELASR